MKRGKAKLLGNDYEFAKISGGIHVSIHPLLVTMSFRLLFLPTSYFVILSHLNVISSDSYASIYFLCQKSDGVPRSYRSSMVFSIPTGQICLKTFYSMILLFPLVYAHTMYLEFRLKIPWIF